MNALHLSKSKYCALWQCPKLAWLKKYKPELQTIDEATLAIMKTGSEVGDLAMGLFGDFVEVTAYDGEKLNLKRMIEATKAEVDRGTPIICEASFSYNGLYCAVDILKKEDGGWAIYEVKSSTHSEREIYAADVAFQKYILEHCGVNVTGTYLVVINIEYMFDGELKLDEFFRVADVSEAVAEKSREVEELLLIAERYLNKPAEPPIDLSMACHKPYVCSYWAYCTRELPKPNVFDLINMHFDKKLSRYYAGAVSFEELWKSKFYHNPIQLRQIDCTLHHRGDVVIVEEIRKFVSTLKYPLYFLDFETVQYAVPRYIGSKPYEQIPFQYSLHYIEREGGELTFDDIDAIANQYFDTSAKKINVQTVQSVIEEQYGGELHHREFLAEAGTDPRRAIAEALCRDIPKDACVTAYNKSFECGRLKYLAGLFPDLAEHLMSIRENIVDLLDPFKSGWYYNSAMGKSFSIKSVLPALFPDDPELNYHNLEDIHNGSEAMNAFPAMEHMEPEELERTRRNLLKYCELDTLAMVKIWERLKEVSKE